MTRLSLSKAWEESRQIFKKDGGLLSAVALALLVLPQIVAGVVAPGEEPSIAGRLVGMLAALIGVVGQLAIVRLALGPSTTVAQAIGHGIRRFPAMLGALILLMIGLGLFLIPLMAILVGAGIVEVPAPGTQPSASFATVALLLAVGAVLLAVRFMLTVPVASGEPSGPLHILKRSWSLTKGRYWTLFGLELLLLVAALFLLLTGQMIGGIIGEIVGGDATPFSLSALLFSFIVALTQSVFTVLASVMLARVYAQLTGAGEPEVSVPSTGT